MVERLPTRHKALGSNPHAAKNQNNKKSRGRRRRGRERESRRGRGKGRSKAAFLFPKLLSPSSAVGISWRRDNVVLSVCHCAWDE